MKSILIKKQIIKVPNNAVAIEYYENSDFRVWTNADIRLAFNWGKGTMVDFNRYINDNKKFAKFIVL